jgi:hypothetical protein
MTGHNRVPARPPGLRPDAGGSLGEQVLAHEFRDRYYDAALFAKYMGLNKRGLREVGNQK